MTSYKDIQKLIASELKEYKALKVAIENQHELNVAGIGQIFPVLVNNYAAKEIKYRQVQRALNEGLTNEERMILERKYLGSYPETDLAIYLDLSLRKDQYYQVKKQAVQQLAIALGII